MSQLTTCGKSMCVRGKALVALLLLRQTLLTDWRHAAFKLEGFWKAHFALPGSLETMTRTGAATSVHPGPRMTLAGNAKLYLQRLR